MKRVIKTAPLVLVLVLAACLNPADPAEPDLDLYREVNNSGLNPEAANIGIGYFFGFDGTALDLTPGAGYRNYVELTRTTDQLNIFKDNDQAAQTVKDSFEFKALGPIAAGLLTYTPYPEGDIIPIKSVEAAEGGTRLRIFLDLNLTVSEVIQLRINAEKLVGARGEKLDTNQNLVAGEPEDDVYNNWDVDGPSVTRINSLGTGRGQERNRQIFQELINTGTGLLAATPNFIFTLRPDAKYDVQARLTWNLAKSLGGLEEDSYIKQTLDAHFFVEKYDREESAWTTVSGAWAVNPLNGQATFTASAAAEDFEIFRLNLKGRKDIVTQGAYFGFTQKLPPISYVAPVAYVSASDEEQVIDPAIPNTSFMTTAATIAGPNWINDKGGWLDLTMPGTVLGVDPATLVKENFRLYAARGANAGDVLSPVRGIPVDSVSQYLDGTTVHIIIKLDPNYKKFDSTGTNTFANRYRNPPDPSPGPDNLATNLQLWIGNVKVYDNTGNELYLGSANVLRTNGVEDFFGLYGSIATANNF